MHQDSNQINPVMVLIRKYTNRIHSKYLSMAVCYNFLIGTNFPNKVFRHVVDVG